MNLRLVAVNITCTVSDTLSGLATQQCPTINVKASALGIGVHNYTATATDRAGNVTTQSFTITVRPQTPLTVVRADYDRQLEDVGFPGAAVELWGTVNRQNRPGETENASDRQNGQTANRSDEHGNDHTNGKVEVQWEPGGPFGPARLEGARFTASTTYRSTGIRLVTVRYLHDPQR